MPGLTRSKPRRATFDWQTARERLERATEDRARHDPVERDRVLTERARALARRSSDSVATLAPNLGLVELLHFRLARERYAIEARYVHRVIRPAEITRLPGAPPQLRGVSNLRGEILPVFDLRDWFEVERIAPTEETRWLVLGTHAAELCMWVDGVDDVLGIDSRSLHRSEREDRRTQELVQGVTQFAHSVLDGARLLAHPELFIGEAGSARGEVRS
jgi:purine-binding chemotaxis protein CheW